MKMVHDSSRAMFISCHYTDQWSSYCTVAARAGWDTTTLTKVGRGALFWVPRNDLVAWVEEIKRVPHRADTPQRGAHKGVFGHRRRWRTLPRPLC